MKVNGRQSPKIGMFLALMTAALAGLYAGGGREVDTKVTLTKPPVYISPGNTAAGTSELTVDNIRLQIDQNGSIKRYTLTISDVEGNTIYEVSEEQLEGRGFFGDLLNVGEVPQVQIPDSITWNGNNTAGTRVSDGTYQYQISVLDNWDFIAASAPLSVVVDTVAPVIVDLSLDAGILSPNGDGVGDVLNFAIQGEPAYEWKAEILNDSGSVVWTSATKASGTTAASDILPPRTIPWDGKPTDTAQASQDGYVADGDYRFKITATDRAGNAGSKELPIKVIRSGGNATISLTEAAHNLTLGTMVNTDIDDSEGIESWSLTIKDSEGLTYRVLSGQGTPPAEIAFDGLVNPADPKTGRTAIPDGSYTFELSLRYVNGFNGASNKLSVESDSSMPRAELSIGTGLKATRPGSAIVFGGESRGFLSVTALGDANATWALILKPVDVEDENTLIVNRGYRMNLPVPADANPASGDPVLLMDGEWDGTIPAGTERVLWDADDIATDDGMVEIDTIIENGLWEMTVTGVDQSGNRGGSAAARFRFDTSPAPGMTVSADTYQINRSTGEYATVSVETAAAEGVELMSVSLVSENGDTVYTRTAEAVLNSVLWAGTDNDGLPVPLGTYRVEVTGEFLNGNRASATLPEALTVYTETTGVTPIEPTEDELVRLIDENGVLRLIVPPIYFGGNSADLVEPAGETNDMNLRILRSLARVIQKIPESTTIRIDGHATYVKSESQRSQEQAEELIPLSDQRADAVRRALVILGVDRNRFDRMAFGGDKPVVPHDQADERWQNRRVEFTLP